MQLFLLSSAALGLTWWLVEITRTWAIGRGRLDVPCGRSAHVTPVPRLGGLAVALVMALGLIAGWVIGVLPSSMPALVGVSLLVLGVGLVDDLTGLPATPRLVAHFVAAALTVWIAGPIRVPAVDGTALDLGPLAVPLTVLWIAWFINAFNFMDGIDGMAGSQAVVAGTVWAGIGLAGGATAPAWWGLLLAAAAVGFLRHNWSPARVFMGDGGATALGYWLAVFPLISREPWHTACGFLLLWPFAADATLTLVQRIRAREVLAAGHQRHYYQRLVHTGWSHASVALIYAAWAAATAMLGVLARLELVSTGLEVTAVLGAPVVLIAVVRWRERGAAAGWARPAPAMKAPGRPHEEVL